MGFVDFVDLDNHDAPALDEAQRIQLSSFGELWDYGL